MINAKEKLRVKKVIKIVNNFLKQSQKIEQKKNNLLAKIKI